MPIWQRKILHPMRKHRFSSINIMSYQKLLACNRASNFSWGLIQYHLIRNPYWSQTTEVFVNDESLPAIKGYLRINRTWKNQESITLKLDMRTEAIYPVPYESQDLMVVWDKDRMIP